jgi:hypothetical protein
MGKYAPPRMQPTVEKPIIMEVIAFFDFNARATAKEKQTVNKENKHRNNTKIHIGNPI